MTLFEIASTVLSAGALVVSVLAYLKASRGTDHGLQLTHGQLRTAQGQLEVDLRRMITDAKLRVEELFKEHGEFLAKAEARLSSAEKKRRERLKTSAHAAIEGYLSALDSACGKYLDPGKIDKERFKKDYQREIRQVVQDKAHAEYFGPGHAYNALMTVYEEWENPERRKTA